MKIFSVLYCLFGKSTEIDCFCPQISVHPQRVREYGTCRDEKFSDLQKFCAGKSVSRFKREVLSTQAKHDSWHSFKTSIFYSSNKNDSYKKISFVLLLTAPQLPSTSQFAKNLRGDATAKFWCNNKMMMGENDVITLWFYATIKWSLRIRSKFLYLSSAL